MQTTGSERAQRWASTMGGFAPGRHDRLDIRFAHADSCARIELRDVPPLGLRPETGRGIDRGVSGGLDRAAREDAEAQTLARGATRATGAGHRLRAEAPDDWRTCFERDRDRILHSAAFRRLAGKTQVFIYPEDHQRTRLTHALEVTQVATAVARACRLNVTLTEAIALGHDCGHGPGGHASEDALDPLLPDGFDHAPWGADVSLRRLNLCAETLDGIRNHSWSRPAPATPEGEVVSWADRIAYVCHDWEDAVRAGVVRPGQLPASVRARCGDRHSRQLGVFIEALVDTIVSTGHVGTDPETAEVLSDFRRCNYELIYLREDSLVQGSAVISVLRALVGHYADRPHCLPSSPATERLEAGSPGATEAAVTYVAGMTDRFAFRCAVDVLGWDPLKLPRSVDGGFV